MKDRVSHIALVAPTAADARDVMVEGESGILAVSPPGELPAYEPSKRRLTWPNGAIATLFSAEEPNRLRGPQHGAAWCDELAAWGQDQETWDMLQFGLRLGEHPRVIVTTTPRPTPLVRELVGDPSTVVTRGSTYDNAPNLARPFLEKIRRRYEGTRLGRQELLAEILDDLPGALWTRRMFDEHRVAAPPRQMRRIVVAVDPSGTAGDPGEDADDVGIVVAGLGADGRGYVLEDATVNLSPEGWGRAAIAAYHRWRANLVIAERNFGGDMVRYVLSSIDRAVPYREVVAARGKAVRAEPVAALYEQGRVSHVGVFRELEDQATQMTPRGYEGGGSPDRLDALVWALTDLMVDDAKAGALTRDVVQVAGRRSGPGGHRTRGARGIVDGYRM